MPSENSKYVISRASLDDLLTLLTWLHSPSELYQWAGFNFKWPIDITQFKKHYSEMTESIDTKNSYKIFDKTSELLCYGEIGDGNDNNGMLTRFIVNPELRGKGCCSLFLRMMINEIRINYDFEYLNLNVFTFNEPAIRCYRNVGFKMLSDSTDKETPDGEIWRSNKMRLIVK
jgi:RimJ/RimL family protein N-acetyltransferase